MRILWALLLSSALISCSNQKTTSLLSPDALPTQTFRINTARDTVVKTAGGALLQIGKGSFSVGGEVELEVKEAYLMEDIVKAGLTTTSDGELLSSGGMIYLDAVDKSVTLQKQVKVSLPTVEFDGGMKLYTGKAEGGKINWVDAKPLADSMPAYIRGGRAIFDANCATCHALDKTLTGPALRGVEQRGPWSNRAALFAFTLNPGVFIPLTTYSKCLAHAYSGQIMPSFPQLSDSALAAVYDYIKFGAGRDGEGVVRTPCEDSCRRYDSVQALLAIQWLERSRLAKANGSPMREMPDTSSVPQIFVEDQPVEAASQNQASEIENKKPNHYQFAIESFGWYNVDRLLKGDAAFKESELTVILQGKQDAEVEIYLVIPSLKVFTKGRLAENGNQFVFYGEDRKLPLPQGAEAYILALGENENVYSLGTKKFRTVLSQTITIEAKPSNKTELDAILKSLESVAANAEENESKAMTEIRKANKKIDSLVYEAEKLVPKNCDCHCVDHAGNLVSADIMQIIPLQ